MDTVLTSMVAASAAVIILRELVIDTSPRVLAGQSPRPPAATRAKFACSGLNFGAAGNRCAEPGWPLQAARREDAAEGGEPPPQGGREGG